MSSSRRSSLVLTLRDVLRKCLSAGYFVLIKLLLPRSRYVGSRGLVKECKRSDTIFILATGQSINKYTEDDFARISDADSIGVNFFVFHEFVPSIYLIEPHPQEKGYFEVLDARHQGSIDTPILYKGYASPRKLLNIVRNIRSVPRRAKRFFVAKDAYIREASWAATPAVLKEKALTATESDYLYNYLASLVYVVFLAYKMGYRSIVLCGFDMSDRYFYCEDERLFSLADRYNLCSAESANKIHADMGRQKIIRNVLSDISLKLGSERQGAIYVYKEDTSLSDILPVYSKEATN